MLAQYMELLLLTASQLIKAPDVTDIFNQKLE